MKIITQTGPKLPAGSNLCKSLISELAAQINKHHRLAYRHAAKAIEHARQAGELLIKAKSEIPHGGWLPWLEANCDVGEREAQRYMRLATRWDELKSDTVTDLSLKSAIELLTEPQVNHVDYEGNQDDHVGDDRYPLLVPGHSAFCYIDVNNFLIYIISESSKHPGYWYLGDMVHKTITTRPCKPEGIRYLLSQDLRISGGPRIAHWKLQPVEYLF